MFPAVGSRRQRIYRSVAVLSALGLTLTGCSGSTDGDGPQSARELTIAVPEDVGPLNIFASHEEPLTELVYDKLLAPSPYVEAPQPWLASAVRQIDPSTWQVDLRNDVTWHDGEPFTTEDVVFTFKFFKAAPTGRWTHHVSDTPNIETITALDDDTVEFKCAYPCPFLGSVTLADIPIIPEHIWAHVGADDVREVTTLPVGTGPYRLTDYSPTTGYRFEANAEYFAGAPRVNLLTMPVIEDSSATFTALRTGEIDATTRPVPPELVEQFRNSDDIAVVTTRPFHQPEIKLNYERSPFDQPEFRRALSRALDRDQLLETVFLGQGRASVMGYPHPDSPWTSPGLSTPSDPDEARTLLDHLGFTDRNGDGVREGPNGPLSYTLYGPGQDPVLMRAGELVAEDLREVGVGVRVQGIDAGALADLDDSRDFDMRISSMYAHGLADPTQFIMSHRSGYLWKEGLPYPEWDALYEQWRSADTIEARTETLFAMQQLFNRQPTAIPLVYPDENWAYRSGSFDGWVESPGYGVVHKWSLLPVEVSRTAHAIVAGQ